MPKACKYCVLQSKKRPIITTRNQFQKNLQICSYCVLQKLVFYMFFEKFWIIPPPTKTLANRKLLLKQCVQTQRFRF